MVRRRSSLYEGLLSKKHIDDIENFYHNAYAIIRDELQKQGRGLSAATLHYETLGYLKTNPVDLKNLLNNYMNVSPYNEAVTAVKDLKLNPATKEKNLSTALRQAKSTARAGNFISSETASNISTGISEAKKGFTDLTKHKNATFIPDTSNAYSGRKLPVTPSVFATDFKNQREMALYVRNAFDNGFKNAKVGDVITGSTNTSKDSYSLQMDYLMRMHKKNPTSTKPVFLGYEYMNGASFSDKFNLLSTEEQLNAINTKLNRLQKETGLNFDFDTRFPYIDENGQIKIPQWGLQKVEDVPINVSKRKFGGQVEYGTRPFMGYLPFTHHQIQ
jgi:hypothetical protein